MAFPVAPVALAGVSILSKLFSAGSEERERERRRNSLIRLIDEDTSRQLRETGAFLNKGLLSRLAAAKQGGTRAALALGRKNEAASFTAPIESQASNVFAEALERSTLRINQNATAQKFAVNAGFSERPIQPTFGDIVGDVAEGASNYLLNKDLIETQFPGANTSTTAGAYRPNVTDILGGSGVKRKTAMNFSGLYGR